MFVLFIIMLAISIWDLKTCVIPDILIVIGIINNLFFYESHFINAFIITIPLLVLTNMMKKIKKKEVFGGGDIKLIFMLSLYFDSFTSLFSLIIACLIGVLCFVKNKQEYLPFAPCICLGYLIMSII